MDNGEQDFKEHKKPGPPKNFEVKEVEALISQEGFEKGDLENESLDVEVIEVWDDFDMRAYIARSIINLWTIWTFVGLLTYVANGNGFLLLSSPAMVSVPLFKVISYYFRKR